MKIESRKPCIDEPVPRAGTDTHVENMRVDTAAGTTGRAALTRARARAHTHLGSEEGLRGRGGCV